MEPEEWSVERSRQVFGLAKNDLYFLDVEESGELYIRLGNHTIGFRDIAERVRTLSETKAGYTSSFTIRMPQLIASQIAKLRRSFVQAIAETDYRGSFSAVYPVKVNQRSDCVIPVLRADRQYGIEAGTKTELLLIESVLGDEKDRLVMCNGAKDTEYLKAIRAMVGKGFNMAVSLESLYEAQLAQRIFKDQPANLVLRIKPYISARGHWSHSGGRDSKFGLSIHDLLDTVESLKAAGFKDQVRMIHGHVGSQITSIEDFEKFSAFMTRSFCEIRQMGLTNVEAINFGGGLPIDYTSSYPADLMGLYARAIVAGIRNELTRWPSDSVPPNIIIESGRGITALASMVVVKALEVRSVFPSGKKLRKDTVKQRDEWMARMKTAASTSELIGVWDEFQAARSGLPATLDELQEREQLTGELRAEARHQIARLGLQDGKSDRLIETMWQPEHIVIGNFSIFNSACDHVLVKQHFPVIPIRDLHVRPETTVRLVDITCDSDGEISQFHRQGVGSIWFTRDYRPVAMPSSEMGTGIPVGFLKNVKDSHFVIALTGAYQDVIEMNHNLLGDLPDVQLLLADDGSWKVSWESGAQAIEKILEEVGYRGLDIDEDPYMSSEED